MSADLANGCYVEGHRGIYAGMAVIELAETYGFKPTEEDQAYISAFNQGEDTVRLKSLDGTTTEVVDSFDGYCWAVEDAEQFLNDSVAPAGSYFGWYDGEFYLWSQKEWEETV